MLTLPTQKSYYIKCAAIYEHAIHVIEPVKATVAQITHVQNCHTFLGLYYPSYINHICFLDNL